MTGLSLPGEGPLWLIGCGTMGGSMLRCWLGAGLDPARVTVIRPSGAAVADGIRVVTALPLDEVPAAVMLGVKPQMLGAVVPGLAPMLARETLLISILAGVELATLGQLFPGVERLCRTMPNTPVALGQGVVGLCERGLSAADRAAIQGLMTPLGLVEWVDEALFDVVTALAGSGPAFLFRFVDALAAAGADAGLEPVQAQRLALATVAGAGRLAQAGTASPAELAERVASKGGSTRRGLDVLDEASALRALMRETLDAAVLRNREMAQEARAALG